LQELLASNKSSKCKAHLSVCPNYTPPAPTQPVQAELAAENLRLKQLLQDKRPAKRARPETMVIYALLLEGNFVYTGKTANPDARLASHASRSSQCRLVRNAFKKHGRAKFTLKVLMRCSAADADANESSWIVKNNTLHPNGFNLRHGAAAGEDLSDKQIVPAFSGVVPFEGEADEAEAEGESWSDLADVLREGDAVDEKEAAQEEATKRAVDAALKAVLRETHPDRAGDRTFTATEVAALVNSVREEAL